MASQQYFLDPNDVNFRQSQARVAMVPRSRIIGDPRALQRQIQMQQLMQQAGPLQQLNSLDQDPDPYGMGSADGPEIDARFGAVPGRQIILRQATQLVDSAVPAGTAIDATSAFTQADQDALGAGRPLEGVIGSVVIAGTMPAGYDAENLRAAAYSALVLRVLVQGQLQDEVPFDAALDTGFQQRLLKLRLRFDSGAYGAVSFNFNSKGAVMPAPAAATYTVFLRAKCMFGTSSRRYRARQR